MPGLRSCPSPAPGWYASCGSAGGAGRQSPVHFGDGAVGTCDRPGPGLCRSRVIGPVLKCSFIRTVPGSDADSGLGCSRLGVRRYLQAPPLSTPSPGLCHTLPASSDHGPVPLHPLCPQRSSLTVDPFTGLVETLTECPPGARPAVPTPAPCCPAQAGSSRGVGSAKRSCWIFHELGSGSPPPLPHRCMGRARA